MSNLEKLRETIKDHPPGPLMDTAFSALREAWDELEIFDDSKFYSSKLYRAEDLTWSPPIITFTIERHGGMACGSSRAEVYIWSINVEAGIASSGHTGYRQIVPMDKRLNIKALADELIDIIERKDDDPRISYLTNERNEIRLLVSETVTANNNQTLVSRRKRFRAQFNEKMEANGWKLIKRNYTYRKVDV